MRFSVIWFIFIDGSDLVAEKKRNEKEKSTPILSDWSAVPSCYLKTTCYN